MKHLSFVHLAKKITPSPVKTYIKTLMAELPLNRLRNEINDLKNEMNDLKVQLQQNEDVIYETKALPRPPKHLQIRVVGSYLGDFIRSGYRTFDAMEEMLQSQANTSLRDFNTILDFGCGCGRNIRSLKQMLPSSALYGCDIDEEAITWLKCNYRSVGEFNNNPPLPPTLYSDDMFDFIYSISIFTHLPEDMQFAWLEELKRITRHGGYLFLTTHGEKHYGSLKPSDIRIMKEKGFFYEKVGLTEGLPEFY